MEGAWLLRETRSKEGPAETEHSGGAGGLPCFPGIGGLEFKVQVIW